MKKNWFWIGPLLIAAIVAVSFTFRHTEANEVAYEIALAPKNYILKEYGIPVMKFSVDRNLITKDAYLGKILAKYKVPGNIIDSLLRASTHVFDVRKMKAGQPYTAFVNRDSASSLAYLVYEVNDVEYVVFNLKDSVSVKREMHEVVVKERTVSGLIHSNLWQSLDDSGIDPLISNDLSEVYAWTIDFFGLQVGDKYKMIIEEKFVEGKYVGYGAIKGAYFNHMGKMYYAIPFKQDSISEFFDKDGQSLRKNFLKAPLRYSRISSGFTSARMHPILKKFMPHFGVDYSAPMGTPVVAIADGTVIHAEYTGAAGHYIKIQHGSAYMTGYMHLSKYESGIRPGTHVRQGDVIGYVGSTGRSTGPHLDFRVWLNNQPINPLQIDATPVEPVKAEHMPRFIQERDVLLDLLNNTSSDYQEVAAGF